MSDRPAPTDTLADPAAGASPPAQILTDSAKQTEAEPSAASPANHWKRRPRAPALPREQAVRQGEITSLAFLRLGRERAIAFLNADHEALGGRPLEVATESAEGAAAVEAEVERMANAGSQPA